MPWETGATEGKYRYHPGGNKSAPPKDAPSAVNVVVVPDVTLPKVQSSFIQGPFCTSIPGAFADCLDSACTTSTTNGARMGTRRGIDQMGSMGGAMGDSELNQCVNRLDTVKV